MTMRTMTLIQTTLQTTEMMSLTTGRERDSVKGLPLEQVWQVVRQPVDSSDPLAPAELVVAAAAADMAVGWAAV